MPIYHHIKSVKTLNNYKSSKIAMPSGEIFYASLKNSINAESGHEGTAHNQNYEFVIEDGIECIKSNSNSAVIQYPTWEEITGNNSLSMSFWIKGKCEHSNDNIITYGTWATDKLRAARFMGSGANALLGCESGEDFVEGGIKTTDDNGNPKWMHIVVVFENLNNAFEYRVYGDTVLGYINHRNVVNTTIDSSRRGLFLFSRPDAGEQHYNGCLCAVRLYNRVLSQEEIITLSQEFVPLTEYQSTGTDEFGHSIEYNCASDAKCNITRIPKNGLVFYAPLTSIEQYAETGQSLSSYGNNVIYQKINGIDCGYFNGSRLSTSDIVNWNEVTLSVWLLCCTTNGQTTSALHIGADANNQMFKIGEWNGLPFVSRYGTVDETVDISILNKFHHVLATYNGSIVNFYIDGVLCKTINNSGSVTPSFITLGSDSNNSYQFNGYIAKARIYNRILNDTEISILSKELNPDSFE